MGIAPEAVREADRALARRAADGDRGAQRELFLQHRNSVHHTLFRILGSNRELEDLVQDAFFEIFRALPSFRGESTLTRWCQTIATRVAYLAISRRKPQAIDLALVEDTLSDDRDARREAHIREAARRLYAALERLDPKHRIAYALATIDGNSMAEVAALTESSVVAVKTRVWRARKELMKRAAKDEVLSTYLDALEGRPR